MKLNQIILLSGLAFSLGLTSCDAYLDKQPDDMQTLKMVFAKRTSTEQYLANVLSFMPAQYDIICTKNSGKRTGWPFVAVSDECEAGAVRDYAYMQNGSQSSSNPVIDFWVPFYQGIREANVFLKHIGECKELKEGELEEWSAEARYARAMCHYWLATLYGPIILEKDEITNVNKPIEYRERDTWDDCVKYISDELLAVSKQLPDKQSNTYYGKPTRMAALAYRSRLLLLSASPLMNGNKYYQNMKKEDGTPLFPTTYDASKWQQAADAAKDIIDMCEHEEVPYGLLTGTDAEEKKGVTYKKVFTENWNKELLDATDMGSDTYLFDVQSAPMGGRFVYGGAMFGATQLQVDAYAMSDGRYPITGYENKETPIIDKSTGYTENGFSTYTVPTFTSTAMNDPNTAGFSGEMYNMYKNREPRFYASIVYNEDEWPNSVSGPVYINKFGTDQPSSTDYGRTGYLVSKFVNPSTNTTTYTYNVRRTWPNFRYAEILLNYTEAMIELGKTAEALPYWNMVRKRGGVPNIEDVYPDVTTDKELARFLIRRERQVEFAFEGNRYFDANRWMIADQTNNGKMYSMNVNITNGDNMRSEFYKRTAFETRVFKKRNYLQPIPQTSLTKNLKLKQTTGW